VSVQLGTIAGPSGCAVPKPELQLEQGGDMFAAPVAIVPPAPTRLDRKFHRLRLLMSFVSFSDKTSLRSRSVRPILSRGYFEGSLQEHAATIFTAQLLLSSIHPPTFTCRSVSTYQPSLSTSSTKICSWQCGAYLFSKEGKGECHGSPDSNFAFD